MTYPDQSNFNTSEAGSAWWTVTSHDPGGDTLVVCSTTGYTFVGALQQKLGVTVDRKWGPATSRALSAAIRAAGGPDVLATAVDADAATRTLRVGSLAAAVWLLHRQDIGDASSGVDVSDLSIPTDTVPPRWSASPPSPVVEDPGYIQCVRQASPASVQDGTSSAQGTASAPTTSLATVPSPVPAIPPATLTPVLSLPTGLAPPATPHGSSISWAAIGVVAAVAVVGIGLAIALTPRSSLREPGTRTAIHPPPPRHAVRRGRRSRKARR